MENFTPMLTYAIALAIAAAIPGPGIAAVVGQSLGNGFRASFALSAGIAVGDIVYLTAAVAGLTAVTTLFSGAFLAIKMIGGLYLVYLAYRFWTNEAGLTTERLSRPRSNVKSFLAGLAVTIGNPKTIVFYLALLPTVLKLEDVTFARWMELCAITVIVLFIVLTPYAYFAAKARGMMKSVRALRILNRSAAAIIGGAGATILGQATIELARRS